MHTRRGATALTSPGPVVRCSRGKSREEPFLRTTPKSGLLKYSPPCIAYVPAEFLAALICTRLAGAKKAIATAALAVSLSTMGVSGARAAAVADVEFDEDVMEDVELVQEDTEVDFTGMRKLSLGEQVIKYSILGGMFGGAAIYTFYEGKQADRDEEDRVKAEVERIEKWKAEFIDMDDVVSDDDLMASLNKRTSGEEGEDVKDLDGTGKIAADYDPEAEILKQQLAKTQKELEKKESEAKAVEEEEAKASLEDKPAEIDAEQMERLKRMFGGGEDAPKDK